MGAGGTAGGASIARGMPRGATARLFVAVDPPIDVLEALAEWARRATAGLGRRTAGDRGASLRLLEPHLLHLTLCFLGARPVGELRALESVLEGCAAHAGELAVGTPLWLPRRRPRALAVAIDDRDGELTRLQGQVSGAVAEVSGWEPERRRFRPHITLARLRAAPRDRDPQDRAEAVLPATPRLEFVPESLSLYRSFLSPSGASYESLASCALLPPGG